MLPPSTAVTGIAVNIIPPDLHSAPSSVQMFIDLPTFLLCSWVMLEKQDYVFIPNKTIFRTIFQHHLPLWSAYLKKVKK